MKRQMMMIGLVVLILVGTFVGCSKEVKMDLDVEDSLYDDPVLQYLGWKQKDIIELYGEPDIRDSIGGPGGEFLYYREKNISFIFAGDEKVVNNLELFPGGKVLEVRVGMTFDEIEEILGLSRWRDDCDPYWQGYSMVYFLGEERDDMGEVEMYFGAASDDAPTESVMVLWKKYWW